MKTKEITVSVKLTENFNSHQVTQTWVMDENEEPDVKQLLKQLESTVTGYLIEKTLGG